MPGEAELMVEAVAALGKQYGVYPSELREGGFSHDGPPALFHQDEPPCRPYRRHCRYHHTALSRVVATATATTTTSSENAELPLPQPFSNPVGFRWWTSPEAVAAACPGGIATVDGLACWRSVVAMAAPLLPPSAGLIGTPPRRPGADDPHVCRSTA